jgi:integrase
MATFQTRNGRVTVTIRKKGHRAMSRTFATHFLAAQWAKEIERNIERGGLFDYSTLRTTTVGDMIAQYRDEVVPQHRGYKWETNRANALLKEPLSLLALEDNLPAAFRLWRDERLLAVAASTVNRDLNFLSAIFSHARKEWGVPIENPIGQVKRPKVVGGARDVVWTDDQLKLFVAHLEFDRERAPKTVREWLGWFLQLLVLTGVRRQALAATKIEWIDIAGRSIHYPANVIKNGEKYDCPLRADACVLFERLISYRGASGRLFKPPSDTFTTVFGLVRAEIARTVPAVAQLRMHDLRHTWTTKIARSTKVNQLTLLKMSGRKSMQELARYYNPRARDLADMLDDVDGSKALPPEGDA